MNWQCFTLCGVTLILAGCIEAQAEPDDTDQPIGETGIAITAVIDTSGDTDVAQVRYNIARVACVANEQFGALYRDIQVNLESVQAPAGLPAGKDNGLDGSSQHQFADHFEVLPAGCYDITATPQNASSADSQDCAAANANGIQVQDGLTTEVFLLSQCKGAPVGALDAAVALNKPPQLTELTFSPSKFIRAGEQTVVCATAIDPNGDPLEFAWGQVGGTMGVTGITSTTNPDGSVTECATIAPPSAGDYMFEVRIYDLVQNELGNRVRIEQWLNDRGYPNDSRDSLQFPVHVGEAAPAGGG